MTETIAFQKPINIAGQKIHYQSKGKSPRIVIFLGVGQSGRNLETITKNIASGIVVEALPYHSFRRDELGAAGLAAVNAIIDIALKTTGKPIHIIAESQAAPGAVVAANHRPNDIASLTLLAPLGFNKNFLGNTDAERYRNLMQRSRAFWNHPNQRLTIKGNRTTLQNVITASLFKLHRIKPDYTFGANQDVAVTACELAKHVPITIYADPHDSLFPYSEITSTIAKSPITLIRTAIGSHINRATPLGLAELQNVITAIK